MSHTTARKFGSRVEHRRHKRPLSARHGARGERVIISCPTYSTTAADYPAQTPATGNTQLRNCRRALLYAPGTTGLRIDGGGTIDGRGDAFGGGESARLILIWAVLSEDVAIRNLYLKKGAMWSLVSGPTTSATSTGSASAAAPRGSPSRTPGRCSSPTTSPT
jgi:hypothetical protein